TASFRGIRGHTIIAACLDETAFWRSEESANPDREVLDALRPAMATVPGALLLCASSPYAKRGILYDAYRRHWGRPGPALVWKADSRTMNPTLPEAVIRTDIAGFLDRALVDAAIDAGTLVRPPIAGVRYVGFADPSGGARDSFTVGIAHIENGVAILDAIFERRPPFNPAAVVAEIK